ncbi:DUF2851 family protein [Galbibacter sp. BG1]|uniref:DUF2851 family protein n=1 Tax=Galbibacter sp. BG1 TaxID=1170699 RepID=UPI0015BB0E22|nr:DUF2851 family protein [Galbibacter sp. BG1]QLE01673.1 DUF2851 family protein [Galbibacter sp. BG1]
MKEDFLHYIWKFKKFEHSRLKIHTGEVLEIISLGTHNHHSGPDFLNAQLKIGNQHWAGNVEMHLKSSMWFAHHHEKDSAYNNVILHVVWEHDVEVFNQSNVQIPTLVLKDLVNNRTLLSYRNLVASHKKFINCETHISEVDPFLRERWLERLYFERLKKKSDFIDKELLISKNDWEAVLFKLLLKNFGSKINGEAFETIAAHLPFTVFRKNTHSLQNLEALLFGISNLLPTDVIDVYPQTLQEEYKYLKVKFSLAETAITPEFFKLRPYNFPTLRLAQIAALYHKEQNLFQKIMETKKVEKFYRIFNVVASPYWDDHFTFRKETPLVRKKKLSKELVDLLLINTIIPLKFCFAKHAGKDINEEIIEILRTLKSEKNNLVDKFKNLQLPVRSSLESQAVLELYHNYCSKNKCLHCEIGVQLIG